MDSKINDNISLTNSKSKNRKLIIVIFTILFVLLTILGITVFIVPYVKYCNSIKLQNNSKYDDAIALYKELGEYKDSRNKIKECNYQKVLVDIENMNYTDAINIISEIKDYKDYNELYKEIKYLQAKQFIEKYSYSDAISNFEELNDYKDSKALLIETKYQRAIALYNIDSFSISKEIFKSLENYKESKEYLLKIEKIQRIYGIKQIGSSDDIIEVSKSSCTLYMVNNDKEIIKTTYKVTNEDDILKIGDKYTIYLKDGYAYINGIYGREERLYYASEIPYYPKVGMSASKVKKSTWGSPNRVNKTTNTYGVSEQWVYSGNKYIYLDDGVVTSIQD